MTRIDVPPAMWQPLGGLPCEQLAETRLELHWALQIVGAVPLAFLEQTPDSSHANLGWVPDDATFVTRRVGASQAIRVGLEVVDFRLAIRDDADAVVDALPLEGKSLDEGYGWMAEMMGQYGVGDVEATALHRPERDFPAHPVRTGAPFTGGDPQARAELARWYDNSLLLLSEVAQEHGNASPVRTWPHHFDMATLLTLEPGEDPERMRSVGVGMTPGDASYSEPYIYAAPWPVPTSPNVLPSLDGGGTWHTEGWVGPVLRCSRLVAAGSDPAAQADQARAFLASAIPAAHALAGG
jgi:hypothetical protein